MESKTIKLNKNKSGSGSVTNRIVLPASWVKELGLEDEVKISLEGNKIIIEKADIKND